MILSKGNSKGTSSSDELISSSPLSPSIITLSCDSLSLVSSVLSCSSASSSCFPIVSSSLGFVSLDFDFCLISLSLGSLYVWYDEDDANAVNTLLDWRVLN